MQTCLTESPQKPTMTTPSECSDSVCVHNEVGFCMQIDLLWEVDWFC